MRFYLKFSVLGFYHCWVKWKPSFPLPLPFFLGEEKQKCLTLPKASFGELPKACPIPCGSWAPWSHSGVGDRSVQWERKSRSWRQRGSLVSGCAGEGWKAPHTLREPSLFFSLLVPGMALPPKEWGLRDAGTTHSCLFMFIWKRHVSRALPAYGKGNGSQGDN